MTCANLLGEAGVLHESHIGSLRLLPQDCDMVAVVQAFRDVLDGRDDVDCGNRRIARPIQVCLSRTGSCSRSLGTSTALTAQSRRRARRGKPELCCPRLLPRYATTESTQERFRQRSVSAANARSFP